MPSSDEMDCGKSMERYTIQQEQQASEHVKAGRLFTVPLIYNIDFMQLTTLTKINIHIADYTPLCLGGNQMSRLSVYCIFMYLQKIGSCTVEILSSTALMVAASTSTTTATEWTTVETDLMKRIVVSLYKFNLFPSVQEYA